MERTPNPYPPGTVAHAGWERGWFEAHICAMYEVPMALVLPNPRR
jgi:hypothetical protein